MGRARHRHRARRSKHVKGIGRAHIKERARFSPTIHSQPSLPKGKKLRTSKTQKLHRRIPENQPLTLRSRRNPGGCPWWSAERYHMVSSCPWCGTFISDIGEDLIHPFGEDADLYYSRYHNGCLVEFEIGRESRRISDMHPP
jgi:hypothetical protein